MMLSGTVYHCDLARIDNFFLHNILQYRHELIYLFNNVMMRGDFIYYQPHNCLKFFGSSYLFPIQCLLDE